MLRRAPLELAGVVAALDHEQRVEREEGPHVQARELLPSAQEDHAMHALGPHAWLRCSPRRRGGQHRASRRLSHAAAGSCLPSREIAQPARRSARSGSPCAVLRFRPVNVNIQQIAPGRHGCTRGAHGAELQVRASCPTLAAPPSSRLHCTLCVHASTTALAASATAGTACLRSLPTMLPRPPSSNTPRVTGARDRWAMRWPSAPASSPAATPVSNRRSRPHSSSSSAERVSRPPSRPSSPSLPGGSALRSSSSCSGDVLVLALQARRSCCEGTAHTVCRTTRSQICGPQRAPHLCTLCLMTCVYAARKTVPSGAAAASAATTSASTAAARPSTVPAARPRQHTAPCSACSRSWRVVRLVSSVSVAGAAAAAPPGGGPPDAARCISRSSTPPPGPAASEHKEMRCPSCACRRGVALVPRPRRTAVRYVPVAGRRTLLLLAVEGLLPALHLRHVRQHVPAAAASAAAALPLGLLRRRRGRARP